MRIAEYKQISEEVIESTVMVDDHDEDGNVIGQHEEKVTETKPVMGLVYRDMTEEEVAEMERQQAELPAPEPTEEERITQLESENAMLLECVLELSQIVYA